MSTETTSSDGSLVRSEVSEGIVAELQLDHPDFVLRPTLRRVPDATVEPEYRTTLESGRTLLFCTVSSCSFDEFERSLVTDPTVRDPVLVDREEDRRVYRVELTDDVRPMTDKMIELGGRILEISNCREGWVLQLQLPGRDALISLNEYFTDNDISVFVNHIRTSADAADGPLCLTSKQQELLTVAYREGYFDVPRGISQDELAERLDVSKSAVSQRLRRAMAELCGTTLS